jgi:hypothetical protein
MKVVVIETLDLEVVKLPFPVVFFPKREGRRKLLVYTQWSL